MKLLDLTSTSPAENLAIDEALLEAAEATPNHPEVFRLWEPVEPLVVIGRSSPIKTEVNLPFCRSNHIPVLRRCSGGQSIVTGPGCLMYAVLLDYRIRPELRMLEVAHRFVMTRIKQSVENLGVHVNIDGTSDLTLNGCKFSGNALRCKRNFLIYHGTLLVDFDLALIQKCLGTPIREPEYRQKRSHLDFLTQLPVEKSRLREELASVWQASDSFKTLSQNDVDELKAKYQSESWTFKV